MKWPFTWYCDDNRFASSMCYTVFCIAYYLSNQRRFIQCSQKPKTSCKLLSYILLKFIASICLWIAEHKVIIVGLDNAGKTTILYQLWVIYVGYILCAVPMYIICALSAHLQTELYVFTFVLIHISECISKWSCFPEIFSSLFTFPCSTVLFPVIMCDDYWNL